MAKQKQSTSSMLIAGAGRLARSQGFVDYGEVISKGAEPVMKALQKSQAVAQAIRDKAAQQTAQYLRSMKSDIDALQSPPEDQKAITTKLMELKNEYAAAASAINNYQVGTPEYMEQLDIMNGVNNQFAQIKKNQDELKEFNEQYLEGDKKGQFSNGNDAYQIATNSNVATGNRELVIGPGGNFQFKLPDGNMVDLKDMNMPFNKSYGKSKELADMKMTVMNSGVWNSVKAQATEQELEAMFAENPDDFRSMARDGLYKGVDFSDIPEDVVTNPAKLEELKAAMIPKILGDFQNAASVGKAMKNQENGNTNSQNGSPLRDTDINKQAGIIEAYNSLSANGTYNELDFYDFNYAPVTSNKKSIASPNDYRIRKQPDGAVIEVKNPKTGNYVPITESPEDFFENKLLIPIE
jgi:hypothetical protein